MNGNGLDRRARSCMGKYRNKKHEYQDNCKCNNQNYSPSHWFKINLYNLNFHISFILVLPVMAQWNDSISCWYYYNTQMGWEIWLYRDKRSMEMENAVSFALDAICYSKQPNCNWSGVALRTDGPQEKIPQSDLVWNTSLASFFAGKLSLTILELERAGFAPTPTMEQPSYSVFQQSITPDIERSFDLPLRT